MFHDRIAEAKFASLQKEFGFKVCIETGTHLGHGALHANKVCEVITIDHNEEFRQKSAEYWKSQGYTILKVTPEFTVASTDQRSITSLHGHSPDRLKVLLSELPSQPICFYLDAHWNGCPLLEELSVIAEFHPKNCVIIIHDVKVPGKDFAYDHYGVDLSYDYVKDHLARINPNFKIYHNEECDPKDEPYSSARGILYATP